MEYKDVATYIAHIDEPNSTGTPVGDPTGADITPNADGFLMGDEQYYSKEKVDALLSTQESTLKAWATGQFEPKSAG